MSHIKSFYDQQYGKAKWTFYDGILKRLRCTKDEQENISVASLTEERYYDTPIFACKFSEKPGCESILALADEDGKICIHDTSKKKTSYGFRAHHNAVFDLAWMFGNMKLVTASGDHTARVFDVSNAAIREETTFYGHSRSVKTVACRQEDPGTFASGGRDGNIIIWDSRSEDNMVVGKADRIIFHSHLVKKPTIPAGGKKKGGATGGGGWCYSANSQSLRGYGSTSVTGLAFQDSNTLISCGAGDGIIKVWDLRKTYTNIRQEPLAKHEIVCGSKAAPKGFSSIMIDPNGGNLLYANCLDNSIYSYNLNSYSSVPVMRYRGLQNSTYYVKSCLSKDGRYLVSGSSNNDAYIWNVDEAKPLVKLVGHGQEVTCVAWCSSARMDEFCVVTCSDDMTHKIWRVGDEEPPENWQAEDRGRAEVIPADDDDKSTSNPKKRMYVANRRIPAESEQCDTTPAKKFLSPCLKCDAATTELYCENCAKNSASSSQTAANKRKHSFELCSAEEAKKLCTALTSFSRKKLFGNGSDNISSNSSSVKPLDGSSDDNTDSDARLLLLREDEDFSPQSPTANLPNYVMDGVAPHLNLSPPKRRKPDWLTRLRIERKLKRDTASSSATTSADSALGASPRKMPKIDNSGSAASESPSGASRKKHSKMVLQQQSAILKFVKVKSDGHGGGCSKVSTAATSAASQGGVAASSASVLGSPRTPQPESSQ